MKNWLTFLDICQLSILFLPVYHNTSFFYNVPEIRVEYGYESIGVYCLLLMHFTAFISLHWGSLKKELNPTEDSAKHLKLRRVQVLFALLFSGLFVYMFWSYTSINISVPGIGIILSCGLSLLSLGSTEIYYRSFKN